MSGTLGGECQPTSDRVNDFGCRLQARECIGPPDGPPLSTRGACLDSRRPETVAPPRAPSRHGCRTCNVAPLGHDASPPLVPWRTGGRGPFSMPGTQHAAGRYEVLAPTWTHPGGKGPLHGSPRTCTGIPTPSARKLGIQKSSTHQASRR